MHVPETWLEIILEYIGDHFISLQGVFFGLNVNWPGFVLFGTLTPIYTSSNKPDLKK
jgi:hypothetical protein